MLWDYLVFEKYCTGAVARRHFARLAQIPSTSLGTGSSLRKSGLLRMTIKLHHYPGPPRVGTNALLSYNRRNRFHQEIQEEISDEGRMVFPQD